MTFGFPRTSTAFCDKGTFCLFHSWSLVGSKLSFQACVLPSQTKDFTSSHSCFNSKDNDRPYVRVGEIAGTLAPDAHSPLFNLGALALDA